MSVMPSNLFLQTRPERVRFLWLLIGVANFIAFLVHLSTDGMCAFPTGGRHVAGQYFVPSHGKEIAFSPFGFWFSYIHGWIFVIVTVACMIAIRRLQRRNASENESQSA